MDLSKACSCMNNKAQIDGIVKNKAQISSTLQGQKQIISDFSMLQFIAYQYNGLESDNIIVTVDNDEKTIIATIKPIQFATKADFPEIGSDRLLYLVVDEENSIYRWDNELQDYQFVCKNFSFHLAQLDDDVQTLQAQFDSLDSITAQQTKDIAKNKEDIAQNKDDIYKNSEDISNLKTAVQSNSNKIQQNEQSIASNKTDIRKNATDISELQERLLVDETNIQQNASDIDKLETEVENIKQTQEDTDKDIDTIKEDIKTLQDTKLEDFKVNGKSSVVAKVGELTISLEQDQQNSLVYYLKVNDESVGTIDIPKDQFLKSVSPLSDDYKITFTWETSEGETTTTVDFKALVDVYKAGDGLQLDSGAFSVKLDPETNAALTVSENGLKLDLTEVADEITQLGNELNEVNQTISNMASQIIDIQEQANEQDGQISQLFTRKQDKLIAGEGIEISDDNVISATGGGGISSIPPATQTVLGGMRAWVDEDGYVCFSTYTYENYQLGRKLYVNGAYSVVQQGDQLKLI